MHKTVSYVNFNTDANPELLAKLNAVASHGGRSVHNLAEHALLQYLNEQIRKFGIKIKKCVTQSARAG